jgi:hypothetical protein
MNQVKALLEREDFFDAAIRRHGFADYMRDYEIIVSGRYGPSRDDVHRYHFVGCVEARYTTALVPESFVRSLGDEFVYAGPDYPDKREPDGVIWGTRWSGAYPGLEYIDEGERAKHWTRVCGIPMHEIELTTEAFQLTLVFADARHEYLGREADVNLPKQFPIAGGDDGAA